MITYETVAFMKVYFQKVFSSMGSCCFQSISPLVEEICLWHKQMPLRRRTALSELCFEHWLNWCMISDKHRKSQSFHSRFAFTWPWDLSLQRAAHARQPLQELSRYSTWGTGRIPLYSLEWHAEQYGVVMFFSSEVMGRGLHLLSAQRRLTSRSACRGLCRRPCANQQWLPS